MNKWAARKEAMGANDKQETNVQEQQKWKKKKFK
jgi:hypothetical protein